MIYNYKILIMLIIFLKGEKLSKNTMKKLRWCVNVSLIQARGEDQKTRNKKCENDDMAHIQIAGFETTCMFVTKKKTTINFVAPKDNMKRLC